jgi:hypothetical protein
MKRCPACSTTYTDESLRYCLADGMTLTPVEEETIVRSSANPVRIDIPRADTTPQVQPLVSETKKSGFPIVKVLLALVAVGVVLIGAVGIIGAIIYFNSKETTANQNTKSTTPVLSATPSPTIDPEKQRLQDQLANAQKQLDEQKNANITQRPPAFPTPNQPNQPGVVTARVNSPGDGFLAMRSEPSADYGDRIAKIPHGAIVNIQNCEREKIRIGNRTGRWCMVTYGDHVGWVFDAWLDY